MLGVFGFFGLPMSNRAEMEETHLQRGHCVAAQSRTKDIVPGWSGGIMHASHAHIPGSRPTKSA